MSTINLRYSKAKELIQKTNKLYDVVDRQEIKRQEIKKEYYLKLYKLKSIIFFLLVIIIFFY